MKKTMALFLLLVAATSVVVAQEIDEDALFGLPTEEENPVNEDALFGGNSEEDALFGGGTDENSSEAGLFDGGALVEVIEDAETADNNVNALLETESTRIGGNFSFSTSSSFDPEAEDIFGDSNHGYSLGSQLYLDARPSADFRFFLKGRIDYPSTIINEDFTASILNEPTLEMRELFSDVNIGDLFLRVGKQNITWGVGYFYSPADLLSLTTIDPENPDEELEGPVAVKAHLPIGSNNLYLYGVLDDLLQNNTMAVAPKFEFLLGSMEVGLGAYYQPEKPIAGMLTATWSFGDISLFGEAVGQYGSSIKVAVEENGLYYTTTREEDFFFMGTVGGMGNFSDDEGYFSFMVMAQYYFNGQGYEDPSILQEPQVLMMQNPMAPELTMEDITGSIRHNAAATVSWNGLLKTDFSLSGMWIANLSDGSGLVDIGGSYSGVNNLGLSCGYRFTYGEETDFYPLINPNPSLYFNISLGTGRF